MNIYRIIIIIIVLLLIEGKGDGAMAGFIGRERELGQLRSRYQSGRFECVIVYGRRRIGKTELIKEFTRDKPAILFSAVENNIGKNVAALSAGIATYRNGTEGNAAGPVPVFANFSDAIEEVFRLAERERLICVIDEYPYLVKADASVSSVLQHAIDRHKDTSRLMFILSGSSMSFMERQVLGYQSPLYGRRTAQIKLEPFDYATARRFVPAMSHEDAAVVYGLTGGVPQYLLQIDDELGIEENLRRNILDPSCYLFEEPAKLLQEELRKPYEYNGIIEAIASGASRFNDIALGSHIDAHTLSPYLRNLIDLGLVERETPFDRPASRKAVYRIRDSFFRFWYRYVPTYMTLIQFGHADVAAAQVMADLPRFMGPVFEGMCRQWLWINNATDAVPFLLLHAGRWWGGDPATQRQEEIDIVATGMDRSQTLYCECKWRNQPTGVEELRLLQHRSDLVPSDDRHWMLFSKSGFTEELVDVAAGDTRVSLVPFADM